MYMFSRRLK